MLRKQLNILKAGRSPRNENSVLYKYSSAAEAQKKFNENIVAEIQGKLATDLLEWKRTLLLWVNSWPIDGKKSLDRFRLDQHSSIQTSGNWISFIRRRSLWSERWWCGQCVAWLCSHHTSTSALKTIKLLTAMLVRICTINLDVLRTFQVIN